MMLPLRNFYPCECQLSHEVQEHSIGDTTKSIKDTMHIIEAWHTGKHADELSLNVMSYTRALETDILRLVHLRGTGEGVLEMIDSWHSTILQELEEHQRSHPTPLVMEHARKGSKKISWRNFPGLIAQKTDERWNEVHRSNRNQAASSSAVINQAAATTTDSVGYPASAATAMDSAGDQEEGTNN